ncbi:MAG: T9SS type A sorting domain-containing protein [Bacteroidales bacterium]|nr:T9SS type A sorting domain-containing protein [Bacteroidales bacterium]
MKKYLVTAVFFLVASFTMAQIKVEPPVLVTPANNATNQMPDVLLDWNAVIGAINYELQLSENADFTAIVFDSITDLTAVKTSLLKFSLQHHWRVRAIYEGNSTSEWSAVWSFTTFTKFDLFRPNNDAVKQVPDINLQWRDRVGQILISGVTFFDVQIDTVNTFDSPNLQEFMVTGTTFNKPMANLYFGVKYFWRARAGHTNDISGWSDVRNFTTLNIIDLKKPDNNSVNNHLNVNLRWDDISGLTKFEYQVDDNAEFASPDVELTENIIEPAKNLMYGTQYFWRMRGRHEVDTTDWSLVWNFTTFTTPVLTSPANGDTGVVLRPQLRWDQIKGTIKYEINYCKDLEMLDSKIYYKDASDDEIPLLNVNTDLESSTLYYWRVRAMSAIDTSDFSPVWTFTTSSPVGVPEYFKDSELAIFPNPAHDVINIQINTNQRTDVELAIYDLLGQAVFKRNLSLNAGFNQSELLLGDISNGIYLIKLVKDDQIYTNKIIISK